MIIHLGPEDIAKMSAAFEAALDKLGLVDRSDLATHEAAKLIIEFAKQGQRDPERLCAATVRRLSKLQAPLRAGLLSLASTKAQPCIGTREICCGCWLRLRPSSKGAIILYLKQFF
jgi:hypothetical protein